MTTPTVVEKIDVIGNDSLQAVGQDGVYQGVVLAHQGGKTRNAIGKGRRYQVELTGGVITAILIDYAKVAKEELKDAAEDRKAAIRAELVGATTISVKWIEDFHDHTEALTEQERTAFVLKFLAKPKMDSSPKTDEFAILATDPEGESGSGMTQWRICGKIYNRNASTGTVYVRLWHYGPGSKHS
ncbi:hypothetical protein [Catellatospora sp. TT07R-123]|uniref:hypothetical protein n=1 Tax=Catellatospora sp. TT07R-123 TaxID=2733863 RepID=UPI001BB3FB60|nr:hypothetical protein [Catellatospora sp. TT07R-123]